MEKTKKINLSAIMKKPLENEFNLTNEQWEHIESTTHPTIKAWVTINISSIKSDKIVEEVIIEEVEEVIKDEKTLFYESLTSRVLPIKKRKIQEKKKKIDLKSTKKSDKNDDEKEDKENNCKTIIDKDWEEKEVCDINLWVNSKKVDNDLFLNYQSDYKKKESIVIDTIHKLKKLADIKKLTKTNKVFVVSIIMVTVLWLSFLFYIDPETHSLENYKTSILTIAWKEVTQDELNNHQIEITNDIIWQLNQNNLWWYQLDFEILTNNNWEAIYKFDWTEYNSKDSLDIGIRERLKKLKKFKIKNYLRTKKEISN